MRPLGFGTIAFILWFFGFVGVLSLIGVKYVGITVAVAYLISGIPALIAGYGVWKLKPWTILAFGIFAVSMIVNLFVIEFGAEKERYVYFFPRLIVYLTVLSGVFFYVRLGIKHGGAMQGKL